MAPSHRRVTGAGRLKHAPEIVDRPLEPLLQLHLGLPAQALLGKGYLWLALQRVVDIEDAATGRVRLRRNVDKLDEMELDTASTKTTRVRPQ